VQAQLTAAPSEDLNKEMTEAEREKINSYEEAFQKIYEETGVATMQVRQKVTVGILSIQKKLFSLFVHIRMSLNAIKDKVIKHDAWNRIRSTRSKRLKS
jgi:hypothetical protein